MSFVTGTAQRRGKRSATVFTSHSHGTQVPHSSSNLLLQPGGQFRATSKRRKTASIGDDYATGLVIHGSHDFHTMEGTDPNSATPPISGQDLANPDFPISYTGRGTMKFVAPVRIPTIDGSIHVNGQVYSSNGLLTSQGQPSSTGVKTGGILSIGSPTSTYTITDGTGQIETAGSIVDVTWENMTNQVITDPAPLQPGGTPVSNLADRILTYVCINSAGTALVSAEKPNRSKLRTCVFLGILVHVDGATVNAVNNEQLYLYNNTNSIHDLANAIGFINVSGNVISKGTAATDIVKSEGEMFYFGGNYETDTTDPNVKSLPEIDTGTTGTFQYRMQDGTSSALTLTAFNNDILDDNTNYPGTTLSNNQWGVSRVYSFLSNALKIQPPQFEYSTSDGAIAAINSEGWVQEPSLSNGLLVGYVVHKEGDDLSTAIFIVAPKFGQGGGAAAGLDISTKLSLDGTSTMTGALEMGGQAINDIGTTLNFTIDPTFTCDDVADDVNIFNTTTTGTIEMGTGVTTGEIGIGTNASRTGEAYIGNSSGTGAVSLYSGTGLINIGSTQTSGVLNLGTSATRTAAINIGNAANTGDIDCITLGDVNLGTAAGTASQGNTTIANQLIMGNKGTETQGTSETFTVELNKPAGVLTLFAATLGLGSFTEFTFTNSYISASSVLLLTLHGEDDDGGVNNNVQFTIHAHQLGSGTCQITYGNPYNANWDNSTTLKIHFLVL